MQFEEVFRRVLWQAEERRAAHERVLAEMRYVEGLRALLLRLAWRRFGVVPEDVARKIEMAGADALRQWAENLVVATRIEEVFGED